MTIEPPKRRQPARSTRPRTPLYDPAFEHDACGIGFVADAGGARRADVLPMALSGLAALAHRGAFGADGASSDGAGVSLPLHATVLRWWHEVGGQAVTFGSDAHAPDHVGRLFREAADTAAAHGFRPGSDPFGWWGRVS